MIQVGCRHEKHENAQKTASEIVSFLCLIVFFVANKLVFCG